MAIVMLVGALGFAADRGFAQEQQAEPRFDVGVRGLVVLSKGEPANDMMGERLIARWRINGDWHVGVVLDSLAFDYETPNKALGIVTATVVDGTNDLSRTSVFVERRYDTSWRWDPYWLAGVGAASVDAPDVAGARADGGAFDIATQADDEIHVFAGGGVLRRLGERWLLDATFTFEYHTTDYELVDRVSGARGSIGSHYPYGIAFGASYRF